MLLSIIYICIKFSVTVCCQLKFAVLRPGISALQCFWYCLTFYWFAAHSVRDNLTKTNFGFTAFMLAICKSDTGFAKPSKPAWETVSLINFLDLLTENW